MPAPRNRLSLEDARQIIILQKFKRSKDFYAWRDRPKNIPSNPRQTYGVAWLGWKYFLGTGAAKKAAKKKVPILPFEEAKALAQKMMQKYGITSQPQWYVWTKTVDKPPGMPIDPYTTYKGEGWISWPDWFGRKPSRASGLEAVLAFSDAREFARSLGLQTSREWYSWAATSARPADIPYSPDTRYREEGWIGWGDFIGFHNRWTHQGIVSFLDSLVPCIEHLTEIDLYLILSKNGMLQRDARLRGAKLLRGLKHARTPSQLETAKQQIADELEAEQEADNSGASGDDASNLIALAELEHDDGSSLRRLDILEAVKAVDRVVALRITDDQEVLEFMVNERISMIWQEAMVSGESTVLSQLNELPAGEFAKMIRIGFEDQLQKVNSLTIPDGYRMLDAKSEPVELNLMQRLTAYRLLHDKRIGNWSGVGAGKTNAAIYSSAVVDARMTLILAANATVTNWKRTIRRAFPDDSIHVHDQKPMEFRFAAGKRNFVVVNYESFQRTWTKDFIKSLTEQSQIDFIVFDEVQFARQRHEASSQMSERRKQVNSLIESAVAANPDLRILAMSATPVVNNLREAVKLLELMLPGQDFSHVPVGASTANAVGVHFLLKRHGIRFVPRYDMKLEKRAVVIDGQEWLDRLLGVRPRDILQMEQTLLEAKLRHLIDWVRRGTLIYTYFVDEIIEPLTKAVEKLGYRVRHFTGKKRNAIEEFVEDFKMNRTDVLIGSAPVGTGVDGLQFVLNRVLFITLPWSHAEYEQIVGRLWRQGSAFEKIEVIIPQVVLREERVGQWSWDDLRLRCIEYKQTLADAALDGIIPKGGLPSRDEMQRRSLVALKTWAENVSKGLPQTESGSELANTLPTVGPDLTPAP